MKKKINKNSVELINIKLQNIQRWQRELNRVVTEAKKEAGIPESELNEWIISQDGKYFEKIKEPKKDK